MVILTSVDFARVCEWSGGERCYSLVRCQCVKADGRRWVGDVESTQRRENGCQMAAGTAYAGQAVRLYVGVFNDGDGAPSGMYVDEVSLVACPP